MKSGTVFMFSDLDPYIAKTMMEENAVKFIAMTQGVQFALSDKAGTTKRKWHEC